MKDDKKPATDSAPAAAPAPAKKAAKVIHTDNSRNGALAARRAARAATKRAK